MNPAIYTDYPQEQMESNAHSFRCVYCKQDTLKISGRLEGHSTNCQYRVRKENDIRVVKELIQKSEEK